MIDKKKLALRLNKGNQLKQLPLLNFAILVITLVEVIGQFFKIYYLQLLKPIPIILMIIYVRGKNKAREHLVPNMIQMGLILSLVGDLCLMSNQMPSFLIGTGFFTIAHIVYIVAFRLGQKIRKLPKFYRKIRKGVYLIIIILLGITNYTLWDLYPFKPLFVVYSITLAIEAIICLHRYQITEVSSFNFTLVGVVLFSVSDNLLGFLKFNQIKTDFGRGIIMLTYYGAQYFIMHGSLHQSNLKYEIDKLQQKKTY